jgi:signal transduction histidine kinase
MIHRLTVAAAATAALTLLPTAFAQQAPLGTPQEARAMLDKAVAAVKADQAVALAMFNKGESGFVDRDLNTFCFRITDGKLLASPRAVPAGTDVRTLKDPTGKNFGVELYAAAQGSDGQIAEVGPYLFPKPGTTAPVVSKVSFVARVGELGCGVGYYK